VHWLIDGYNLIRRSPELSAREREGLEAGRRALCELLSRAARARHDEFTVVFDGAGEGSAAGLAGVRVVFSSAREDADRVLARLAAAQGGAVVSSDREVLRTARRVGAIAITADAFLARIEAVPGAVRTDADEGSEPGERDEPEAAVAGPKKGNPRRPSKKARATARGLGRLGPRSRA
jgi:predicted RNA-binding protein with PIN domain